ncbi:cilia- and flagella-associated protein 298-A isoform X1 [Galleria mellonella]|uniref:Cilia- and flagella-associated protein 298-A isoform X1 n=1 Tax=Galleria mellonella TaxID=7137 RepID=A0ABM3N3C9_GALME|nr:cilia- and flagella-associated protein 298-A isoform X1 [Galleria mellonella]
MVILLVKRGDENQFLYETDINNPVDDVINDVVAIFNGRLKVTRICYELEELRDHGTFLPPEMQGLTDDQIKELKLEDPWAKRCAPPGYVENKDEMGRRCGLAPPPNMQEVLKKASEFAKECISKKHVDLRKCLTQKDVARALDELRGATKIVFPAGLPPHDPVRMELDNVEDLSGTQAANEVIDPSRACMWYCGKKFLSGNKLSDHLGKNNKSKVTVKLCSTSEGAPGREPILTEDERKQLMLHAYRKQEEWKKLEQDDDDNYLNSKWADGQNLKRQFHGLNDISWKPIIRK